MHSTVKDRWNKRDPELIEGMQELGNIAEKGAVILLSGGDMSDNASVMSSLMSNNFATRRKLYRDAVVGSNNINMVELAKSHGLSSKFTGSGGAIVCMNSDGAW